MVLRQGQRNNRFEEVTEVGNNAEVHRNIENWEFQKV